MNPVKIFTGKNEDIPEEYLEQLFALKQQHDEEFYGFFPASLDYYRNAWTISREKGSDSIEAIAIDNKNLVIGFGYAIWSTMYENLDRAWFRIYVTPKERRKGLGTKILKSLLETLPAVIQVFVSDAPKETPGEKFLQNFQKISSYTEEIIVADLEEFNVNEIEKEAIKQRGLALEKGYEILRVDDHRFSVFFDEEEIVKIIEQIWNDMPREDLTEEDMKMTVERYQGICERNQRRGQEYISFVAVHKDLSVVTYNY